MQELIILLVSIAAGCLGSLLGLGGGIIVISVLTGVYDIDIRYAIAASLISIVATSSGAAASYIKDHLTNLRLAVLLEVGTVCGAVVGFLISSSINSRALALFFSAYLLYTAFTMLKKREAHALAQVNHPWADKLKLASSYPVGRGQMQSYLVEKVPQGLFAMFFAGVLSAVLGIGSGIFKVSAMDKAMRLPIKVSSATSNFMIGVTAAGSAIAYFLKGDVRPEIATPVALGIIIGSFIGARLMHRIPSDKLRQIFVVVLIISALNLGYKGLR